MVSLNTKALPGKYTGFRNEGKTRLTRKVAGTCHKRRYKYNNY